MVMTEKKIGELVSMLTLEEKAGLTSGKDNWFTKAVERLGVPQVHTSDGPHGLRTQADPCFWLYRTGVHGGRHQSAAGNADLFCMVLCGNTDDRISAGFADYEVL